VYLNPMATLHNTCRIIARRGVQGKALWDSRKHMKHRLLSHEDM
jgi:hypothetical protein